MDANQRLNIRKKIFACHYDEIISTAEKDNRLEVLSTSNSFHPDLLKRDKTTLKMLLRYDGSNFSLDNRLLAKKFIV